MSTLSVRADQTPTSEHEPAAPAGFWQRPIVQDVLPFMTSLLFHIAIITVGFLTYKAAVIFITTTQTPIVLPDPALAVDAEATLMPTPLSGIADEKFKPAQDLDPTADPNSTGLSDKAAALLTLHPAGGSDGAESEIAVGLQSNPFGKGNKGTHLNGTETGAGDGNGPGGLGLAPFGQRSLGTPTFRPGNARKLVFLCDASGSMMPKFDALRAELRRAIDGLRANQEFDVIFFYGDGFMAMDQGLMFALPENKRRAYEFLDRVAAHSTSDPIPGLRAAFKTRPELIFMLTDGDFPNNAAVLDEIRKQNAGGHVKVNTIAFMDRGEAYEKLLSDVAKETGGLFRFVSEEDLGKTAK
jgi:hypothetical protein